MCNINAIQIQMQHKFDTNVSGSTMCKVRRKVRKGKGGLDEDENIKSTELLCCVPEDIGGKI